MNNRSVFFPNLDGWRFVSFLLVFFFHSFHTDYSQHKETSIYQFIKYDLFGNGNLGVNFFFVLSGFLITYLLIIEKSTKGINIPYFWMRRILRIWPLFYGCVIFGFWIFPLFKSFMGQTPNETAEVEWYLVFLNNFNFIKNGLPDASVLGVLWSVAVEEQFYFVWPLLLTAVPLRYFPLLLFTILAGSLTYRALHPDPKLLEYHTFSCIGDMVIGAIGAFYSFHSKTFVNAIQNTRVITWIGVYAVAISAFLFRDAVSGFHPILRIIERPLIASIFLAIILEQNFALHSFYKMENNKLFTGLGKITYGLYCLHFIGILIVTNTSRLLGLNDSLWSVLLFETLAALMVTIIIAKLSYKYIEEPLLRLKNHFTIIITR